MSKQLYEEAIADVKKLKEIAEDNAKRAVVEAVAPRIRELIEKELLGESVEEYNEVDENEKQDDVLKDDMTESEVAMSNEDMKFEVDEMENESSCGTKESTFEEVYESIHDESVESNAVFERKISYLEEVINSMKKIDSSLKETKAYSNKVVQLNSMVESLHEYVQENVADPAKRLSCNLKIQNCLKKIEKLQEKKMRSNKSRLDEETISLELTGLPDDIDLESLGVNLVSGDEEGEGEEGGEEAGGEEELDLGGGDEGEEEEAGGEEELDLGGGDEGEEEEAGGEEELAKAESRRLSDNVIVEIDEGMLRREIARMKALREEAVPSTKGTKPGPDEFDDFADAAAEGEPLDMKLREMDEAGEMDEADPVIEIEEDDMEEGGMKRRTDVSPSFKATAQSNVQKNLPESRIQQQMAHELKLQEALKSKARSAAKLYEAAKEKFSKTRTLSERKDISRRGSAHKAAYANFAKRYNESVKRFNKLSQMLAESQRLQSARSNNVASKPAASSGQEAQLRNKLAETNLLNAKLVFTNKLLQSESLTARQKAQVISQLDEAKTLREVKLVYESLAKTLATPRKPMTESRVLGSSSQATRSASAQPLNEGFESERWAKLAGISK